MRRNLTSLINQIKFDCVEWNTQQSRYLSEEMERRRRSALAAKDLLRSMVGLFVFPRLSGTTTIVIFEGLRNKEYMGAFDARSVVVLGSHEERAFANSKGYGFAWSFPIEAAVRAKVYRDLDFFSRIQLLKWRWVLKRKKQVIFFLYEDTQPLGTFLVHLSRVLLTNSRTICVQHGYFSALKHPVRYEGRLCDINFVWDEKQGKLLGLDPDRTFQIGLPYIARAGEGSMSVVLVGVGAPHGDPENYAAALDFFGRIAELTEGELGLEVVYRPHPTEFTDPAVIYALSRKFKSIDQFDKLGRLNSPRSIFVGTVSSLLFEAKQAGHLVVVVRLNDRESPVFDCDLTLFPDNLEAFGHWCRTHAGKLPSDGGGGRENGASPLERFRKAVANAELLQGAD